MVEYSSRRKGEKAFYQACFHGDVALADSLLSANDYLVQDPVISTVLYFHVAKKCGVQLLELFHKRGIPIDFADQMGYTALAWAATYGNVPVLDYLLAKGSDPNCRSLITRIVRPAPFDTNRLEVAAKLVRAGADINQPLPRLPDVNLLTRAMEYGDVELEAFVRANGGLTPEEMRIAGIKLPPPPEILAISDGSAFATSAPDYHAYRGELLGHLNSLFGQVRHQGIRHLDSITDFPMEVLVVPDWKQQGMTLLCTCGLGVEPIACETDATHVMRQELLIGLPSSWPQLEAAIQVRQHFWPIEWLFVLAQHIYANGSPDMPFSVVSTDEPPTPIEAGLPFVAFALAANDQNAHFRFQPSVGDEIHFLHVCPLFPGEHALAMLKGVRALESAFDAQGGIPESVDLDRPCAVV